MTVVKCQGFLSLVDKQHWPELYGASSTALSVLGSST